MLGAREFIYCMEFPRVCSLYQAQERKLLFLYGALKVELLFLQHCYEAALEYRTTFVGIETINYPTVHSVRILLKFISLSLTVPFREHLITSIERETYFVSINEITVGDQQLGQAVI